MPPLRAAQSVKKVSVNCKSKGKKTKEETITGEERTTRTFSKGEQLAPKPTQDKSVKGLSRNLQKFPDSL